MSQKLENNSNVKRMIKLGYTVTDDNPLQVFKKIKSIGGRTYRLGQIEGSDETGFLCRTGTIDMSCLSYEDLNKAIFGFYDDVHEVMDALQSSLGTDDSDQLMSECAFENGLFLRDEYKETAETLESAEEALANLLANLETVPKLIVYENGLAAGTIEKVSMEIANHIVDKEGVTSIFSLDRFKDFDVKLLYDDKAYDHDTLYDVVSRKGLESFGVKRVWPEFDSNVLYLVSDAYGGGSTAFGVIKTEQTLSECANVISRMLHETCNNWTHIATLMLEKNCQ